MKTKALYVVVSREEDTYLEQLFISMTSLKYHSPECHITLLMDSSTKNTLVGIRKKEVSLADEIIVIKLDEALSAQKRSRYLKTNARSYVQGDYLFIDCDTVIVKDISSIDEYQLELAACLDSHAFFHQNPYREMCMKHLKKLGKDISQEKEYFNSGIILAKDTPLVHKFYQKWFENYCMGEEKGVKMDQPSFALTNLQLNMPVRILPDEWNCELKPGVKYLKDCYIVHYLCTNKSRKKTNQLFLLNETSILENIKKDGQISKEIWDLIKDPFCGLSNINHTVAGSDVDFLQTKTFKVFSYLFSRKGNSMLTERILNLCYRLAGKE